MISHPSTFGGDSTARPYRHIKHCSNANQNSMRPPKSSPGILPTKVCGLGHDCPARSTWRRYVVSVDLLFVERCSLLELRGDVEIRVGVGAFVCEPPNPTSLLLAARPDPLKFIAPEL